VAYFCFGGIGRADRPGGAASLHSCSGSRAAQLIGNLASAIGNFGPIIP
jgi:hypothetical protein